MSSLELLDPVVGKAFFGKFSSLRPIQEAAIEPILNGKNVVLSSATGSGKTEAALAPLISLYWRKAVQSDQLFLIYIIPTKALINDIEKRLILPCSSIGVKLGIRHGDTDDLQRGLRPHIVLTTPESLDVLLFRKDINLATIQALVIDEVHLFYNTQRGLQLSVLIKRLQQRVNYKLHWAALSATICNPSNARDFLFGPTEEATFLEYPSTRPIDAHIRYIANENQFYKVINQIISNRPTKLLVFSNSRKECDRLASIISQDQNLQQCVFSHYSSLSPEMRLETERKFSQYKTAICISTSTLELGIDIGDIDAIILWGLPGGVDSFLQRIGRGNRRSTKANVICLVPDTSGTILLDSLRFFCLIEAAKKGELPLRQPYELYGAFCQQFLSMIASDSGKFTRIADLHKQVDHLPYMNRSTSEAILSELEYAGYLQHHGFKNQYGADENLYKLVDYRMIYGNFPYGSQAVEIRHGSMCLGSVPINNLFSINSGEFVRFAGRVWRVLNITPEAFFVEPAKNYKNAKNFKYSGAGIVFEPYLADRIWHLIHKEILPDNLFEKRLQNDLENAIIHIRKNIRVDQIPYVNFFNSFRYLTFAGCIVNKAIALVTNQSRFKANDICLEIPTPINWNTLPDRLQDYESIQNQLFEESAEQSIYQTLLPLDLQSKEYIQSWLKDDSVGKILLRISSSSPVNISGMNNALLSSIIQQPL